MLSKNTLFEFLYQNLHDQITCGHLKPGDTLPSMPQLAAIYNVGIRTVKDVLARLKTEGLIQTTERKPARVIYRAEKTVLLKAMLLVCCGVRSRWQKFIKPWGSFYRPFSFFCRTLRYQKAALLSEAAQKNNCQDTAALDAAFQLCWTNCCAAPTICSITICITVWKLILRLL